jgi:hypothetical protein
MRDRNTAQQVFFLENLRAGAGGGQHCAGKCESKEGSGQKSTIHRLAGPLHDGNSAE